MSFFVPLYTLKLKKMVRKTFTILFYIKRTRTLQNLEAPIVMRITVNGLRAEMSLHVGVEPEKWDPKRGRVKGNSPSANDLNAYLFNHGANHCHPPVKNTTTI